MHGERKSKTCFEFFRGAVYLKTEKRLKQGKANKKRSLFHVKEAPMVIV